ncbi:MAG: T9SS type A sorting domain-containing protein [Bacteroidetes bacterium]|nr:T9SS type A sorting domain-containing protein [Bacteroidota bacterium]
MRLIITTILILSSVLGFCQLPDFSWVNNGGDAAVMKIKTTSAGDYIAVGLFGGTIDFDPGAGTANYTSNSGSQDIFIEKISASGSLLWVRIIGGPGDDYAGDIYIDATGKIYITGSFSGTVDFDPGSGTTNLTSSNGSNDIFMLRLSVGGNFSIVKRFAGNGDEYGENIIADASGNIYLSGSFNNDTVSFSGISVSGSGFNGFVAKLNNTGTATWAYAIPVYSTSDMVVDNNSNIYIGGGFFGSNLDFDPGAGTFYLSAGIRERAYILKLTSSGSFAWAQTYMVYGNNDEIKTMGLLSTGEIVIGMDFEANYLTSEEGYVIAKINPATGTSIWWNEINNMVTFPDACVKDMTIDAADNIYYTGNYSGGQYVAGAYNSFVNADIFLGGYNSAGMPTVGFTIGYTDFNDCEALTIDANGGIVLCGLFSTTLDFNFSPFAVNNLTPVGTEDNFMLKLQQNPSGVWSIAQQQQNQHIAFPNPFQNSIELNMQELHENTSIKIFDLTGQIIFNQNTTVGSKNLKIATLEWPNGIYFLNLKNEKEELNYKLIKN